MKGFLITGTHSGCGKTTITLGIMAALKEKGLRVQPFKVGPDFIDTGLHKIITGRHSRNLDIWMCGEDYVKECFYKNSQNADISIIEGVMGLYDGDFSTARLAALLDIPVILVIDAYGMVESAGAIVKGFMEYSAIAQQRSSAEVFASEFPHFRTSRLIAGIIFNRVASERHYERLKNSVQDVRVLGYLPRDLSFEIPHKHLGLTVAEENPITKETIERLTEAVLKHIDIEKILGEKALMDSLDFTAAPGHLRQFTEPIKIAIAYDKAFCFYYEDNFDLLKNAGAEIIKFSPLSSNKIPDRADAVYIGGGYPELYAKELSNNTYMITAIKKWADAGKPLYAECGGLMYLSKGIYNFEKNFFAMANILPFEIVMRKNRPNLGYREVELSADCPIGKKGDRIRGHEFHYSEIKDRAEERKNIRARKLSMTYSLKDNTGEHLLDEGYRYKNTLASYVHLHFGSNPAIARHFIDFIRE